MESAVIDRATRKKSSGIERTERRTPQRIRERAADGAVQTKIVWSRIGDERIT